MKPVFSYELDLDLNEPEVEKFLDFVADALIQKNININREKELVLAFVSPEHSQKLNKQFREKDKSTDVLSFQSDDPEAMGELILCPEVIETQARDNDWDLQLEYSYMILHGILHLLGYDHETDDKAAAEMYALQDDIFFEYFPGAK